ncbi:MAG: hypothetical protein IJ325_11215 [Clostridia bacterium]|nr:hypothetical protein [Clostridia bacterium]
MVLSTLFFDNFSVDGTIISLPLLIWAIFIGFALAITSATVDKFYCKRFVKALTVQGAVSEESAVTLDELTVSGKGYIRYALKPGKHLVKMVAKTEAGDVVKYYLPEEKRIAAELRYENGEHPIRVLIICIAVLFAAAVLVQKFLPELLTMLDNMITQLKNS